jgi:site-specific recombinase XerD
VNSSKASTLALALKGFFLDYLPRQRALSPHTLQSYRDSLKLLLQFTVGEKGDPSQLALDQFSVEKVTAFLQSLETGRHNRVSTRNVRLSAVHSFFRYVAGQHPEHLEQAQRILSIPFKRTGSPNGALRERRFFSFRLTDSEDGKVVWEQSYEFKKVSQRGNAYR